MKLSSSPSVWVMTAEFAPSIVGGLGTVATELAKALMKQNVRVNVITQSTTHSVHLTQNKGLATVRIPASARYYNHSSSSYKPESIQQLSTRFFPRKPDVIHIHSLEFERAAILLKRKYHIPIVYTCHSLVSMEDGSSLRSIKSQASLLRHADQIIVPSYWLKKEIQKRFYSAASKTKVIPNGVRVGSNGTRVPPHRLMFVGRLIRDKGIEPLIRSISILSGQKKQIRLTVIGKASLKYQKRLKAIAKQIGVLSNIRWLGFLPHGQVQRMYSSHGAVVVPSKLESFGLVALEAMANGIPLISTRAGGLKEFVNPRNAQIITAVDSNAISQAIEAVWKNPGKTKQRLIQAKLMVKRYSWRRMAAEYKTLFLRLQRSGVRSSVKERVK
ncbi:glycosyltransferase family 4 protein [Paenibacillus spongiae]|uniref:Glycosyltransferase family 4 protein n=1 Tax=Paenibacillus spongiae TaxID=2909671 RepID=A0ABY5S251_9BACL|nr:glycosyltransferase family 4 protein [Paenibacillus spongiae]UVI27952.1 glycosyltransferase family 4 protein [Paenibacillus spongiae]